VKFPGVTGEAGLNDPKKSRSGCSFVARYSTQKTNANANLTIEIIKKERVSLSMSASKSPSFSREKNAKENKININRVRFPEAKPRRRGKLASLERSEDASVLFRP